MRSTILSMFMLVAGLTGPVLAQNDVPRMGLLYNKDFDGSMYYECKQTEAFRLDCEFAEVVVRKKAEDDLEKRLAQARKDYAETKTDPNFTANYCKDIARKIADARDFSKGNQAELAGIDAFAKFCEHQTEENYLEITKRQYEQQAATCQVSINTFKQSFKPAENTNSRQTWIVDDTASGVCGVVQLGRLEPVETGNLSTWRYISRKAVTNPNGETVLGMKCSQLDQKEHVYDWQRTRSGHVGCEYVDFGP